MPLMDNVRAGIARILLVFKRVLEWIWNNVIGFIASLESRRIKLPLLVGLFICMLMYVINMLYVMMVDYCRNLAELWIRELRMGLIAEMLQQLGGMVPPGMTLEVNVTSGSEWGYGVFKGY